MGDYRVLDVRPLPDRAGCQPAEIILCELLGNDETPYVTWQRNAPARGGDGGRYWGHYFNQREGLGAARHDFMTRGHAQ